MGFWMISLVCTASSGHFHVMKNFWYRFSEDMRSFNNHARGPTRTILKGLLENVIFNWGIWGLPKFSSSIS